MGKYVHKFETEQERINYINDVGYSEPWISLSTEETIYKYGWKNNHLENPSTIEKEFTSNFTNSDGKVVIDKIKGKSLTWNQLCANTFPITITKDNTAGTSRTYPQCFTVDSTNFTSEGKLYYYAIYYTLNANHSASDSYVYGYQTNVYTFLSRADLQKSAGTYKVSGVRTFKSSSYIPTVQRFYGNIAPGDYFDVTFKSVVFVDLTTMFGTGNEPTADEFEKLYPLTYYDYNTGLQVNNSACAIKSIGFNLLKLTNRTQHALVSMSPKSARTFSEDEYWQCFAANGYTQAKVAVNNLTINDGSLSGTGTNTSGYGVGFPMKVFPNTDYYFNLNNTGCGVSIGYFDKDGINISFVSGSTSRNFKTPINCEWVVFCFGIGSCDFETTDICVNLHDSEMNGTYKKYTENFVWLNLQSITGKLNGNGQSVVIFPEGLKSNEEVYDELTATTATKRIGVNTQEIYTLDTPLDLKYRIYNGGTEEIVPKNTISNVAAPMCIIAHYPII